MAQSVRRFLALHAMPLKAFSRPATNEGLFEMPKSLPEIIPDAYRVLSQVEVYIRGCGLEKPLVELVKLRASQINGCAFCIDMHTKDARKNGETEQRLYLLNAWREAPFYTERERAALAWTERLTRLPTDHGTLDSELFSETETANLTVLIGMINLWNRVSIGGGFHLTAKAA
jgi:AhpD family alkylhydroperoxidase